MTDIWIKTTPAHVGKAYYVTLEVDEDTAKTLTPKAATNYAYGLLSAVAWAEYDAAVFKQLTKMGLDTGGIGQLLGDMRKDRAPLDHSLTDPLRFEPGVNPKGKPFLTIHHRDNAVGQWDIGPAREHAMAMFEAVANADLDTIYLRTLVDIVGLDESVARQAVDDLGKHR